MMAQQNLAPIPARCVVFLLVQLAVVLLGPPLGYTKQGLMLLMG
jgi:hypothetical protein